MIKAYIEDNELISNGKVYEGDIYFGFCCKSFEWEVAMVSPILIWGVCRNSSCPVNDSPTGWYQGVSAVDQEELELYLAEMKVGK